MNIKIIITYWCNTWVNYIFGVKAKIYKFKFEMLCTLFLLKQAISETKDDAAREEAITQFRVGHKTYMGGS